MKPGGRPPGPDDPIVVVDYGMGNIHSMLKALRLFAPKDSVVYSADLERIRSARALVLPGDGAFAAAMEGLAPLRGEIERFVSRGGPLLGVCIGFQILFQDSDEGPGTRANDLVPGLALVPGRIRRFRFEDRSIRVPHMGWNRLLSSDGFEPGDFMYFIHSYRAVEVPREFVLAYAEYGGEHFPSVVQAGPILATQFHPEKSDQAGLELLKQWIESL
ncbi:MAG: imidazole glycerol phosphate synthase subunit HisH [Spirochaetales bacterium]|nr:imidazole glycerol phosphate synthase subunit HisH [Leptospiraceae bacterium]MCP5481120.1 imidazole glycerol phosphate synthase subunit HisH [Spirochaetales bacterium]